MAQKVARGGRSWGGLAVTLAITWLAGCSSNLTNGQGGTGGAGGTVGTGQAGAGGVPAGGAGGLAAGGAGGTSVGGPGGNCVVPNFDPTAACAAPPSASVPYSDPQSLASLIVGQWQRCEGPLQPVGMPVAPDGQDGIEFDLNPGEEQGYAGGLMPSGGPCPSAVLLYDGDEHYAPTSWAFASTAAGPGIVFQDTFGDVLYDNAVFSDGGNRMVLTDPTYDGTYVRRGTLQAGAGGASAGGGAGGASGLGGAAGAGGTSGSPCSPGTSLCADGACSSSTDSGHCGSSCAVCAVGSICSNGTCACVVSGQQVCNGICVDTTSNASDCGSCGNACAFGQTCSAGACLSITGAGGA